MVDRCEKLSGIARSRRNYPILIETVKRVRRKLLLMSWLNLRINARRYIILDTRSKSLKKVGDLIIGKDLG